MKELVSVKVYSKEDSRQAYERELGILKSIAH
jgi:hypothetical protein